MLNALKLTQAKRKSKGIYNRISKEEIYMTWALISSERSTCKRLKVGAVIVDRDLRRVLSWGYNGNYAGGKNTCDSDEPGKCGCIHSEINALISASKEKGMIMFVTDSPCLNCAKCIINAGIEILYYRREYRNKDGINLLRSKIKVIKI